MVQKDKHLKPSSNTDVDSFLSKVKAAPPATRTSGGAGRLLFTMDATASRQAAWEQAMLLQQNMFTNTRGIGELDIQLVYYRGFGECKASGWVNNADTMVSLMRKVSVLAGKTQIERLLRHGLRETRKKPIQAMVFIGDCMEENVDTLGNLAGQLKLVGLPVFIFQEGVDPIASKAFQQIAKLSGGAHCRFDQSSADQLGQLLNAVAAYAAGGRQALLSLSGSSSSAALLLEQLQ